MKRFFRAMPLLYLHQLFTHQYGNMHELSYHGYLQLESLSLISPHVLLDHIAI